MSATESTTEVESPTPRRRARRQRALIEWLVVIVIAVGVSLLIRAYAFQTFFIPSGSMEPTLNIGDRIVVNKLAVELGTINRGDIIVFRAPPEVSQKCDDTVPDLVKRVIGLPGNVVTSKGNTIYINGKALAQPWSHNEPIAPPIGSVTVPKGEYFVMGDNQPNSCDSRYWGDVPRSSIIGKAFVRIWPPSRIGFL